MKSLKRISGFVLCSLFVLGALANTSAMAVTPEEKIEAGIDWLVDQQDDSNGSWGGSWNPVAITGFALIKLQERAYELELDPFETDSAEPDYYEYATNVIAGWQYLFSVNVAGNPLYALKQTPISSPHGDPDTNGNGYGISFRGRSYDTGVCLMALVASRKPNRVNDGGIDYDGDTNPDTFGEIAQDVVDWLAYAQVDSPSSREGAWGYSANSSGDNSVAGYAVLGLSYAKAPLFGFNCTIPNFVNSELNIWINYIQCTTAGADYGGSGYTSPCSWVNELKTGNLIFEMTFYGDATSAQRFKDAMDYIERHWQDLNVQPGWHGDVGIDDDGDGFIDEDPFDWIDNDGDGLVDEDRGRNAHYQAMYCLMKGLEYSGINLIDHDNDGTADHDWYQELATVLLAQQNVDGSWPTSPCYVGTGGSYGAMAPPVLSTIWALLTLEAIAPPPPVITVDIDIKPQSCPNPLNVNNKGLLPVAILGSEDLDVTTIDVASIRLADVAPIRSSFEDVAAPVIDGEECECTTEGPDGYLDLTLKFKTQDIVQALGEVVDGEVLALTLTGELSDETSIEGADCIRVKKPRAKKPK